MSSARPATFALPALQRALAPDLLREPWRSQVCVGAHPHTGHCYVASEALYHQLGGKAAGYTPMFIRHEGQPHWFLRGPDGQVLDPTAAQFRTPVPYERAVAKGFLTTAPSKRAQELRRRAGLGGLGAAPRLQRVAVADLLFFDFDKLDPDTGAPIHSAQVHRYIDQLAAAYRRGAPVPSMEGHRVGRKVRVDDGNHRAAAARRAGLTHVLMRVRPIPDPHLGGLGATFARAAGGAWVGYRVARYDPKRRRAVSGADSRLSHALAPGTAVEFPRVGIWLSHDPAYVEAHYANHDHNVLVRFAFDPRDVTRGSLEDRETEIAVARAVVLSSRVLD